MAIYYFCSGFTLQSITVTANFGNCTDYREYTDEYCHYRTWSRTITFTMSTSAHPLFNVRYRYFQEYYTDGVLEWSGYITAVVNIPAGALTHSIEADCKEERYCNFGGDGLRIPATQD